VIIASCIGDINTHTFVLPILILLLFLLLKNVLTHSLHNNIFALLLTRISCFCVLFGWPMSLSHHLKIPSISLQITKLSHVICHSSPSSNPTMPRVIIIIIFHSIIIDNNIDMVDVNYVRSIGVINIIHTYNIHYIICQESVFNCRLHCNFIKFYQCNHHFFMN
jgi:hypothetical protein